MATITILKDAGRDHYLPDLRLAKLAQTVVRAAFFNLFLVACLGVLLRATPFLSSFPFSYKNLLHAHSHFAFGGWVMPALVVLIQRYFPELSGAIAFQQWRAIYLLILASSYGMLLSFPFQGYGAISIFFSTLSVAGGYYMAIVFWKAVQGKHPKTSYLFLKSGLIYLCLSAAGPFVTGPLIAMGYQGEPVYYNAIYFYLHFQYNGWFLFALLALVYRLIEKGGKDHSGVFAWKLFNLACVPAFALSLLWNKPSLLLNLVGGAAALVQAFALWYLLKDVRKLTLKVSLSRRLLGAAFAALVLKTILQMASALPFVAQLAYEQRNFVIAYLHLVLLGIVSAGAFGLLVERGYLHRTYGLGVGYNLFFFSFITTELLLVVQALGNTSGFGIPQYTQVLLLCSLPFPIGIFLLWWSATRSRSANNMLQSSTLVLLNRQE